MKKWDLFVIIAKSVMSYMVYNDQTYYYIHKNIEKIAAVSIVEMLLMLYMYM